MALRWCDVHRLNPLRLQRSRAHCMRQGTADALQRELSRRLDCHLFDCHPHTTALQCSAQSASRGASTMPSSGRYPMLQARELLSPVCGWLGLFRHTPHKTSSTLPRVCGQLRASAQSTLLPSPDFFRQQLPISPAMLLTIVKDCLVHHLARCAGSSVNMERQVWKTIAREHHSSKLSGTRSWLNRGSAQGT